MFVAAGGGPVGFEMIQHTESRSACVYREPWRSPAVLSSVTIPALARTGMNPGRRQKAASGSRRLMAAGPRQCIVLSGSGLHRFSHTFLGFSFCFALHIIAATRGVDTFPEIRACRHGGKV
jgi:hypothetical protein